MLAACAATSVRETWISPSIHEMQVPAGAVAVLTVAERGMIRTGFENRFARELEKTGQPVVLTHKMLSLSEIKEDQELAATRMLEAGAQTLLITRLVSGEERARSVRAGRERYAPVTTGFSPGLPYAGYGWGGYYSLAFQDMSTVWGSQTRQVQIETSLFRLSDGQPLWSCVTKTSLKESEDGVAEMDRLVDLIVIALREDGLIK